MANLYLTQEKLDALRSEYKPRRPCALLKYPRPKTKPEYQYIYPWLLPDETDPHFVFCTVCECRLSAKRSDLGKHEGSIKHSENTQRKSLLPKPESESAGVSEIKWEYNDDDEGEGLLGDLCKTNDNELEEADGEDEEEEEEDTEAGYEPICKRRVSETYSQHSGMLDYLPLQVTINEMPNAQLAPPSQMTQYQPQASTATAQPCRITIKKVTAPLPKMSSTATTTMTASSAPQTHEITSKATITPIAGSYVTAQRQAYQAKQLHSYQLQSQNTMSLASAQVPARDSFDLFFDSICHTVKSLPPKLATEGKIRVMQLIGELELRAISEREALPAHLPSNNSTAAPVVGVAIVQATDAPGSSSASQQNETVASTTK